MPSASHPACTQAVGTVRCVPTAEPGCGIHAYVDATRRTVAPSAPIYSCTVYSIRDWPIAIADTSITFIPIYAHARTGMTFHRRVISYAHTAHTTQKTTPKLTPPREASQKVPRGVAGVPRFRHPHDGRRGSRVGPHTSDAALRGRFPASPGARPTSTTHARPPSPRLLQSPSAYPPCRGLRRSRVSGPRAYLRAACRGGRAAPPPRSRAAP